MQTFFNVDFSQEIHNTARTLKSAGRRIKFIREKLLDMTQTEFASVFGLTAAARNMSVTKWENDKAVPRMATLQKLSEMGFSIDWIITGRGKVCHDIGKFVSDLSGVCNDDLQYFSLWFLKKSATYSKEEKDRSMYVIEKFFDYRPPKSDDEKLELIKSLIMQ